LWISGGVVACVAVVRRISVLPGLGAGETSHPTQSFRPQNAAAG
jgi:hypothetical protein